MNLLSFVKAVLVCVWILPLAIHLDSRRVAADLDPHQNGLTQALPDNTITLTFDEPQIPLNQSVDGTVLLNRDGDPIPPLSFSYDAAKPVSQTLWFSQDFLNNRRADFETPVLEPADNESVLTLDFGEPVDRVRFEYELQGLPKGRDAVYRVEAYDPLGTLVGSWSRELDGTFQQFEDTMDYDSNVPFSRLQMRFETDRFAGEAIAVGDLSFVPAREPDPTWFDTIWVALIVFVMGVMLLVMRNRRVGRI
ncbi:hypothetical protein [Acanthopleuribacter pedis]|uniref:Transmembrane protein n=1 Tax=Acanthopleuribacter pedis TaxID=442870 RepID=A0A8J7Q6C4_9BACT|nr:hypothetical protein [Acanthopleuribacter pedis]MBO1321322.1 hypothetical protein [Acanthopleuribacter pedis]